jgi:hypothetical protein
MAALEQAGKASQQIATAAEETGRASAEAAGASEHGLKAAQEIAQAVEDIACDWHSDTAKLLSYCVRRQAIGRAFVEKLRPDAEDYFVLRPMQ